MNINLIEKTISVQFQDKGNDSKVATAKNPLR
jgi:hypothetical protein